MNSYVDIGFMRVCVCYLSVYIYMCVCVSTYVFVCVYRKCLYLRTYSTYIYRSS